MQEYMAIRTLSQNSFHINFLQNERGCVSMSTRKFRCSELVDLRGYSPDTILEMMRTEGTEEECKLLLGWLERIYG